jgi:hypothetical protein
VANVVASGANGVGASLNWRCSFGEAHADGLAGRIPFGVEPCIHLAQQDLVDGREGRTDRNRDERLLPHGLAARLDPAFIVALPGPTETGLQQVMRGERGEPRRQSPCAADQDPDDGGPKIIVGDSSRHPIEVRKRADVPVEKADLILALVDPREVAARVHQSHQEEPRLAAGPVDVDQHFEEVDLREVAGPIGQRHEHLASLALPLGDGLFDKRDTDAMTVGDQQFMQPRRGELLLGARPLARFRE